MSFHHLDAVKQADLYGQALDRAHRMRRAAIDDFWRGADAVWQRSLQTGVDGARRAAWRLQARLQHHAGTCRD